MIPSSRRSANAYAVSAAAELAPWPGERVEPEPVKDPDPLVRHRHNPRPGRTPRVPTIPSIDFNPDPGKHPDDWVRPDDHEIRKPTDKEREKKKRLSPSESRKWLETLVGGFTETDDVVSAIYKALPWKVRRWKGRDGVWRDRDINTATRLERLYMESGNLSVKDAIGNLWKAHQNVQNQDLTDKLYGALGDQLKKQVRKLADDGLYSGSTGLGTTRYNETWEKAYEKLKAKAVKDKKHRVIRTRRYDPKTGLWTNHEQTAPVMEIPWMRQESYYPREARRGEAEFWELTQKEKSEHKRTVDRSYYARNRSRNNVYKGNDFPGYKNYRDFYGK